MCACVYETEPHQGIHIDGKSQNYLAKMMSASKGEVQRMCFLVNYNKGVQKGIRLAVRK